MRSYFWLAVAWLFVGCAAHPTPAPSTRLRERTTVLAVDSGVTATIVAPAELDPTQRVDLILYALPNGNTTAQTIGRKMTEGLDWHYDIQHIGAQTRALRERGMPQAIVVYLEANTKSWPEWRRLRGPSANTRIVAIVDRIRHAIGDPPHLAVSLTAHSGGGSFIWGFIEGQSALPDWLERIAFLDANYSFERRHGDAIDAWLGRDPHHILLVLAYDDREITLDGKKVVSDDGGTWRASQRMMDYFRPSHPLTQSTLGEFRRYSAPQIEFLLHPNPENRILHTMLIGEMNGYMHALLVGRPGYSEPVLRSRREYERFVVPQ